MKPYYQDDAVTIYHGDCRDLHYTKADVVVTDPPYGVGKARGTKGAERSHKFAYEQDGRDTPDYVLGHVVPCVEAALVMCGGRGVVTPGSLLFAHYPQPQSFGVFFQPATVGLQRWGRADAQPIFYYGKDPRSGLTIQPCSWVLTESPERNGHPCAKPYRAWARLVEKASLEGETILDPFMGSGTTLRAAKDLGRKAIGIEIEERYCEIAAKRMQQEVLPLGAA